MIHYVHLSVTRSSCSSTKTLVSSGLQRVKRCKFNVQQCTARPPLGDILISHKRGVDQKRGNKKNGVIGTFKSHRRKALGVDVVLVVKSTVTQKSLPGQQNTFWVLFSVIHLIESVISIHWFGGFVMFVVYSGVNVTFAAQKVNCLPGITTIGKKNFNEDTQSIRLPAEKQPVDLLL